MAALLTIEVAEHRQARACTSASAASSACPILPPDINASELRLHGRAGRRAVRPRRRQERRRGRHPVDARSRARSSGASTRSSRLCEHVDLRLVNKRVLESLDQGRRVRLARCRGDDPPSRPAAPGSSPRVDRALEHGGRHQRDRDQGQTQLFGGGSGLRRRRDAPGRGPAARRAAWTESAAARRSRRKPSAST